MFTKLKKFIIRMMIKRYILELKSQGAVLEDIKIDIKEIDGEVYGKLTMVNVLRYYSKYNPMLIWQFNQDRVVEIHSKGWMLYIDEKMEELPETIGK